MKISLTSRLIFLGAALCAVVVMGLLAGGERTEGGVGGLPLAGVVCLGAVGSIFWFKRRRASGRDETRNALSVLEEVRLGPGKRLHVVEFDGRRLLLSCAENGVRLLAGPDREAVTERAEERDAEK